MKLKKDIVKDYIIQNIENGTYSVQGMIESEYELVDILNISRVTVRKALDELVDERILSKQHGRGTFVNTQPKFRRFKNGIGFTREAELRNMVPSSQHIRLKKMRAGESFARDLKINQGSEVYELFRTRCANNRPVAVETSYFPCERVGILTREIAQESVFNHLESIGIIFSYADQRIEAAFPTEYEAKLLGIPQTTPCIKMIVIAYTDKGTPFMFNLTTYSTESFKLIQTVYNT